MPPKINEEKCNGCNNAKESLCEMVCPGDLLFRDEKTGKAKCRSLRDCWDCMACIKACPQRAISIRLPYQLGYYGAELVPFVKKDRIRWECKDIDGNAEIFEVRTRNNLED